MNPRNKTHLDSSTEDKIKEAARKLFTQKGYSAVKTRDIASEAGINIALLNYYFRSKEKLFDIIMLENLQQFIKGVASIINDEHTTLEQKTELLVSNYIDMLIQHPDIPLFILNEIRNDPENLARKMDIENKFTSSYLMKQLQAAIQSGKIQPIHPIHFLANILGLTIFPFIAAPLIRTIGKLDREQFISLMQERKMLIPHWVKTMMISQ